jgi:hypothetical protein
LLSEFKKLKNSKDSEMSNFKSEVDSLKLTINDLNSKLKEWVKANVDLKFKVDILI